MSDIVYGKNSFFEALNNSRITMAYVLNDSEIKKYRIPNEKCYSAKDNIKLQNCFEALIGERTFEKDFNNVTKPLIYDETTYEECEKSLKEIVLFLKKYDL